MTPVDWNCLRLDDAGSGYRLCGSCGPVWWQPNSSSPGRKQRSGSIWSQAGTLPPAPTLQALHTALCGPTDVPQSAWARRAPGWVRLLHFHCALSYPTFPLRTTFQASWHPHSDGHLAVLTSDSRWRLYGLDDLSLAEQAFDLRVALSQPQLLPATGPQQSLPPSIPSTPSAATPRAALPSTPSSTTRFGLGQSASSISVHGVTAFGFGTPVSWGYFSVLFLASNGAVYTLCPACPFGKPGWEFRWPDLSHVWPFGVAVVAMKARYPTLTRMLSSS